MTHSEIVCFVSGIGIGMSLSLLIYTISKKDDAT